MGSPMRQPPDESGPGTSTGSAKTRGEELKVQRNTATSAVRIIKLGIQTSLWLGCMTLSFRARTVTLGARAITVRTSMQRFLAGFLGAMRSDAAVPMRILAYAFSDVWQLTRKLQMFTVLEFLFALLAVFFLGAFPL